MLDKRLKWAFLVVALIFAGLPIAGIILDLLTPPNIEIEQTGSEAKPARDAATPVEPVKEDMVFIPAGEFLRGYNGGGEDHVLFYRSEEHTSEIQSQTKLVCRLLL